MLDKKLYVTNILKFYYNFPPETLVNTLVNVMGTILEDHDKWLIRDALSSRIDRNDFYSWDDTFGKDQFDEALKQDTIELYDRLCEEFKNGN